MSRYANEVTYEDRCMPTPAEGTIETIRNQFEQPIFACMRAVGDFALDPNKKLLWRLDIDILRPALLALLDAARANPEPPPDEVLDIRFCFEQSVLAAIDKATDEVTGELDTEGRALLQALARQLRWALQLVLDAMARKSATGAANDADMRQRPRA